MRRNRVTLFFLMAFLSFRIYSLEWDEQFSLIGLKLPELFEDFGPPDAVYAARGNEVWQDDVVFQYAGKDFFIYKDRVWQVKFSSVFGISLNDPRRAAMLRLGNTADDNGDYALLPLQGGDWPLMIRVNFTAEFVSAIYVYRSDF
ncbi:MAG: hypothetical protein LBB81_07705 [Treponema sp.]|jgi:hypothetical protein|nr:hypothetical protein [Treponema sp.]